MQMTFDYVKDVKGTMVVETRRAFVIHEDKEHLVGFDMKKLTRKEQNLVKRTFAEKPVTDYVPHTKNSPSLDYAKLGIPREIFAKSYRVFSKSKIK